MNRFPDFDPDNSWILKQRGAKNKVDPQKPYTVLVEKERSYDGIIDDVLTVFLTNRECPFKCLMCDLWKNTTDYSVEAEHIIQQITGAINTFQNNNYIKIYNAGNFFDPKAVPPESFERMASILSPFRSVIIENHPRLLDNRCIGFRDLLSSHLEIALGLETVQPDILKKLNKNMSLKHMETALDFLHKAGISTRVFILLRPPFMSEEEGVFWAKKSIDWALQRGVDCCAIIPTRGGNGAMDWLQQNNYFHPPELDSLEQVQAYGIEKEKGRIFADLWDLQLFSSCPACFEERRNRMQTMNLNQTVLPLIPCKCSEKKYAKLKN